MSAALALWIYLALFLLLRGVLGLIPSMWGWGLNVQRFLDPFVGWGLWGAAALTLVPAIARRSMESLEGFGDFLTRSSRAYLWAWVFGAGLTWLMPDRVWFVGDFLIRLGNVESGKFSGNYVSALPLDYFLHSALLHLFGKGSAEAANLALRALGAVEAGGMAALAVAFGRALGATGAMAVLAAGVAFFGGYLTMFTGLGKPASEMCLATLGLAAFGIGVIRNRSSLWPCGVVMAIALGLHRSSVMLLPAWGTVVGAWVRANPGAWKRPSNLLAIALPIAVAVFAIPRIVSIAARYDLSHHVLTLEARREGGLWVEVFSPRHLLDLVNLLSALSPLALAIPILLRVRGREPRTLPSMIPFVLALSFVPALLVIEPQQGIFRDWDVFAPAAAAFSALAATLLVDWLATAPARVWLAVPALALVAMSSLQWLAVNRQGSRGLERVRAYLLEPPWPEEEDRPLVWDFVASRNMRLHRWSAAADAAAHAAVDEPSPRILTMWAISSTLAEDHDEAERVYRRLLEREPDDPLAWLGLAGEARRLHHAAELDSALSRLRSYAPNGPEMKKIRVHLRYFPQVWPPPDSVQGWSPTRALLVEPDTLIVTSGRLHLHALFFHPPGRGPFPGILLNHGSGHDSGKDANGVRDHRHPELLGPLFVRHGYAFLYLYRRGDGLSRGQGSAVGSAMDEALAMGGQTARNKIQARRIQGEDLDDVLVGLAALRSRPEVDPRRVGIVGHSFGGSLSVLLADRDTTLRAAVIFSGSGLSWDRSPELQRLLRAAATRSPVPMFFLHARNDFATAPGESLAAERERLGRPGRVKIYPPIGRTAADGHDFIHSGIATWERDVFSFLDPRMKR